MRSPMPRRPASLGRAARWFFLGALLGAALACPDGVALGLIVAGTVQGVLLWTGIAVLVGAVFGGLLGVLAATLGPRMVLPPSREEEER